MSKIPDHKHSDQELSRLRAQSAMQASNSPIVETYNKKLANKFTIILGYALPLIVPFWGIVSWMAKDSESTMTDFYIMAIPILFALLIALWIAIKRVLSRHNSAFILILSLFCSFPLFSMVNSSEYLKYELLSMIGKEGLTADPLIVNDAESDLVTDSLVGGDTGSAPDAVKEIDEMTDEERKEALRQAEENLRRDRSEWLRDKAARDAAAAELEASEIR